MVRPRVVVLGAGVAGHTAAAFLKRWLGDEAEIEVISPRPDYNWIPSNIWVGVGLLRAEQVVFPLAPVYEQNGIAFRQAKALRLFPEGRGEDRRPFVEAESTAPGSEGQIVAVPYDFLINATGPKLTFEATPGLGPKGHSLSVCTAPHAVEAAAALEEAVARMKRGERQRFLVGTGHGTCTCQGAAFEYIVNLEFELRARGVRDKADITYVSNEFELGDFGMGSIHIRRGGYVTPSNIFTESLFAERGLRWVTGAHVQEVAAGVAKMEFLDGREGEETFDLAMLLPPFKGVGLQAIAADGTDITERLFAPSGFMRVDADYAPKPYESWRAADWPRTYQSPVYPNLFAAGIAFAPPHTVSRPRQSPKGTNITPAPPRTGMPSAMIGKAVARSIVDMIHGAPQPTQTASMAEMGAACIASAGANPFRGTAASSTVLPIVPDFERFPEYGRDLKHTFGEIGLAGHWIKILLHHLFIYKAKMNPLWFLIPE
ncbi:MAG: NAD(P)/FAD-dependent oxidoreductase [Firmicutes bacterium]|nr:NAD(P)/FAD-dependent oxidoreductase [Bacillota bacterium]